MRNCRFHIVVLLPFWVLGQGMFSSYVSAESRLALVIGNGGYSKEAVLKTPPNDARLMADTLRVLNFELFGGRAYVDVTQEQMERLIRDFAEELARRPGSVGLFYYSGHGMQVDNRNFILPVDAEIKDRIDVRVKGVSVDEVVLGRMSLAKTLVNIVLLDACRDNPFEKRVKSLGPSKGLGDMNAERGSIIGFASEPNTVAYEIQGGNYSHFTEALAREIVKPGASITEVLRRVRVAVHAATNGDQVPTTREVLLEDFYLLPAKVQRPLSDTMAKIPAGWFPRGLTDEQVLTVHRQLSSANYDVPEHWLSNTQPATQVWLDTFYLDTHEVTWGEFRRFLTATQGVSRVPDWMRELMPQDEYPAVGATWSQAQAYCAWKGKRLPTEAEWEKAARTDSGHLYPWGDMAPTSDAANFCDRCTGSGLSYQPPEARLSIVGAFQRDRSLYGIYDLAGSVREWVADTYATDYYKRAPERNPRNEPSPEFPSSEFRVVRGGSWIRDATYLPAGRRGGEEQDRSVEDIGFRCAQDAS
jgi:formylglycine-generating enzyme required for sulfatase activity